MESHASSCLYSHTLIIHTHLFRHTDTHIYSLTGTQNNHTLAQPHTHSHRLIGDLGGGLALRERMGPSSSILNELGHEVSQG